MKRKLSVTSQLLMSSSLSAGSAIYLRDGGFSFTFTTLVIGLELGFGLWLCIVCVERYRISRPHTHFRSFDRLG